MIECGIVGILSGNWSINTRQTEHNQHIITIIMKVTYDRDINVR